MSALEPAEPVRRYEREKPGELIYIDIKKLGRIGSVGHRITGRYPGAVIRFTSAILPPYARRSKSLEVLLPVLYLKGVSTGDFAEALAGLLGPDAGGLSASTIARLKEAWVDEHARWRERDLSAKRYVYFWADGIYVQARLEDEAQCLLVIIGATPDGKKELVGLADGVRESTQSWRELLLELKRRGLRHVVRSMMRCCRRPWVKPLPARLRLPPAPLR